MTANRLSVGAGLLVLFILGLGFGSVFLPQTVTHTSTQTTTQTTTSIATLTMTTNASVSLVTATAVTVLVEPVVATCTTVSGTRSIVFVYLFPGETTTVTTIYPSHLPTKYQVTQMTETTVTGSNKTYVKVSDTC